VAGEAEAGRVSRPSIPDEAAHAARVGERQDREGQRNDEHPVADDRDGPPEDQEAEVGQP
jgi:hypothetical protein